MSRPSNSNNILSKNAGFVRKKFEYQENVQWKFVQTREEFGLGKLITFIRYNQFSGMVLCEEIWCVKIWIVRVHSCHSINMALFACRSEQCSFCRSRQTKHYILHAVEFRVNIQDLLIYMAAQEYEKLFQRFHPCSGSFSCRNVFEPFWLKSATVSPEPSSCHFVVSSPSTPTGPLAWIREVLMPTSAPKIQSQCITQRYFRRNSLWEL